MGESIGKVFEVIAQHIILAGAIVIALVALIIFLIVFFIVKKVKKNKKIKKQQQITQAIHDEDGSRYSIEDDVKAYESDGTANASFTKEDIIVGKGTTLVAGKDIATGKYMVLTTVDGIDAFNVRINGFVREIKHNSTIILGDGDNVCPVSHSIILR